MSSLDRHKKTCGGSRRRISRIKRPCRHRDFYLSFAKSKDSGIVRRALTCRSCFAIRLIPCNMVILNDMHAERLELKEDFFL